MLKLGDYVALQLGGLVTAGTITAINPTDGKYIVYLSEYNLAAGRYPKDLYPIPKDMTEDQWLALNHLVRTR